MARPEDVFLPITFTIKEWRWIAIACTRVNKTAFVGDQDLVKAKLRKIALEIAQETGNDA